MAPHTNSLNRENKYYPTSNLINNSYSEQLPTNNSYLSTSINQTITTATIGLTTTTNEISLQQQEQQSYYQQPINTEIFSGNYNNNNNTQFDINSNSVYLPQATTTQILNSNSIDYSPYSTGNTTTPSPIGTVFENINYFCTEEEDGYSSEFEEKNLESMMIAGNNTFNNNKLNKFNLQYGDLDESCSQNQFVDLFAQSQANNTGLQNENYQQFDNFSTPVKQEPMGYDDYNQYQQYQQYQQQLPPFNNLSHQQPGQQQQQKSSKSNKKRDEVRYGPIVVRPRVQAAPTLLTGRKSKYVQLTPEEERKREIRRSRNRAAADKCKRKRLEIEDQLNHTLQTLRDNQKLLTRELEQLTRQKSQLQLMVDRVKSTCCASNTTYQQQQQQPQQQQYQQPQMNFYNSNLYNCN